MPQPRMTGLVWAQASGVAEQGGNGPPPRRSGRGAAGAVARRHWFTEPKSAVWIGLGAAVLIGGGRQLFSWWQARKAVARLLDPDVTDEEIEAVAEHGRVGVYELLRIFSTSPSEPLRQAAGRALARLWRLDQLVAEEEQAIVRRGYAVTWNARRRYPRALHTEIPIAATYGLPFLTDESDGVGPANLEWSHRVLGAGRAAVEEFSPWAPGRGRVEFTIFPGDFETNGPHRLALQTRIRTIGLTDIWQIEPPHVPFSFEFDPVLRLDAILTLPDAARDETIARAIRLERGYPDDSGASTYLSLGNAWTFRDPPRIVVATPLPCDLAHAISIEFEGIAARFDGGRLLVSGQGLPRQGAADPERVLRHFELGPVAPLPAGIFERPGLRRMRIWLEADPASGWADPEIRSIWPGQTQTNWVEVEIMRR
jgi:hypothetical protein